MNIPLVPCPGCQCHIRVCERDCPFCGAAVSQQLDAGAQPVAPNKRLGSLAVMVFRTTALGAALVACSGDDTSSAAVDSGSDTGTGGAMSTGIGGSPNDNIGGRSGTGGVPGIGGQPPTGAGGAPPYDGGQVPIYRATPRGP